MGATLRARSGQRLDPQDGEPQLARRRIRLARGKHQLRVGLARNRATERDGVAHVERDGHRARVGKARRATPHSGRLTAHTMTRWPGSTPAAARTAATRGTIAPRSR